MEIFWPHSQPTDESAEFWSGAARGELRLQYCLGCDTYQHYPRIICSHCHCDDLEWRTSSGLGRVYSHTTVHRAPSKFFRDHIPYVLALVDLDEKVRLLTWIVDCDPDDVRIGLRVEVTFLQAAQDLALPVFRSLPSGN